MYQDNATLVDIAKAPRLALSFTRGISQAAFAKDIKTQSAVLHQLLVLGEAVKRLSPAFRDKHPDLSWADMAGMRDKLIHAYDNVDLDEVWRTVRLDVPQLLQFIDPLLPKEPKHD